MIGSGFSRGARATVVGTSKPPLWSEVAHALRTRLYPDNPRAAPSDPLRLAQEFEDTLSREVLHALLAREIGDRRHRPGPNHRALLRLPWTDVLTTNYDTLLERAVPSSGRRYTPVYTPSDLPAARLPRIVKLHGSLPDHPPLILTEEDYRTYDTQFAPFVTLARARLVEDALVLLGFSGDDPNFLSWTGWVRDHLAEGAPPLYFVTLDLPDPKRTLLVQKNVAPIDLGPFFPITTYPDNDQRHELAFRWFLAELAQGEPAPPSDWPEPPLYSPDQGSVIERLQEEGTYEQLPPLLTPTSERPPQSPSPFETGQSVTAEEQAKGRQEERDLIDLIDPWKTQREQYPGWVVAPKNQRDRLFKTTQKWLFQITRDIDELEAPDDLRLVGELVWRMRHALFPLFREEHVGLLQRTLVRYNPDPSIFSLPPRPHADHDGPEGDGTQTGTESDAAPVAPDPPRTPSKNPEWDWTELSWAWMSVAMAFLQRLREGGQEDRFLRWADALQSLTRGHDEWTARLGYETTLLHLDCLDDDAVRDALQDWPETLEAYAFGEVHRAAVLLELGDRTSAAGAAGRALNRILLDQAALSEPSIELQSQESWARNLLDLVERTGRHDRDAPSIRSLPPEAEGLPADVVPSPVTLFTAVGVHVEKPYPALNSSQTKLGFDTGRETRSYSNLSEEAFRPAAAYLRMRKEGGYPLRAGRSSLDPKQTPRAAGWVRPLLPAASYAALFRYAGKGIEEPFSRTRVAALDQSVTDQLYDTLRRGVQSAFSSLPATRQQSEIGSYTRFQNLLEVLSRLAVRLRGDRAAQALDDGIQLATSSRIQSNPATYKLAGKLIERSAEAASDETLTEKLSVLMTLPIEGQDLATGGTDGLYFEPARFLKIPETDPDTVSSSAVRSLVETLRGEGPVPDVEDREAERRLAQSRAAMRLSALYEAEALTEREVEQFGTAYWALTDKPNALPTLPFLNAAFSFRTPPPSNGPGVAERVRNNLLSSLRDNLDATGSGAVGLPGTWAYFKPFRAATLAPDAKSSSTGVEWSPEEATEILNAVAVWWDAAGPKYLDERERERRNGVSILSAADMLYDQLRLIPLVLVDVVFPFLDDDQTGEATEARRVVSELQQAGFATSITAPYLLRFSLSKAEAVDQIRTDLYRDDTFAIDLAVEAVYRWIQQCQGEDVTMPHRVLIGDVLSALATRRGPNLAQLASKVARILTLAPDLFREENLDRLTSTLAALEEATAHLTPDVALAAPDLEHQNASAAARASLVRLAQVAQQWYDNRDLPRPATIERWGDIAREAPLPETRRAWND